MTAEHNHTTDIVPVTPGKLINSDKALAIRRGQATMTIRYMKTLQQEESLKIQQGVNFDW